MLKAVCDICKKEQPVKSGFNMPTGWTDISISGSVKFKGYCNRHSVRKLLCNTCAIRVFKIDEDTEQKDIKQQFEEIAMDYLNELASEAVQEAMENQ